MFVDLLVISAIPAIDKLGLQHSSPLLWAASTHTGMTVSLTFLAAHWSGEWRSHASEHTSILLAVGVVNALLWAAQAHAYAILQVAYVQALKQVNLLLTVFAGHLFLGEKRPRDRLLGASLVLGGVSLVVVAV